MIKVYVVSGATNYANFLTCKFELVDDMELADLVIFTGGEDVHPSLYDEPKGKQTYYNTSRDLHEIEEFEKAVNLGKIIVGICRGSQFCTAKSGGKLVQHTTGHCNGDHEIEVLGANIKFNITSTHHQMMYPFDMNPSDYTIIAKSSKNLSKTYLDGWDNEKKLPDNFVEPEIVYYNKTNCLCIQGHPEYMPKKSEAVKFINMLVNELLDDVVKKEQPKSQLNHKKKWK